MLRNILVILLVTLGFVAAGAATPQDTLVSKAYVQKLEERINKLESDSSGIALGKERLGVINERIDNLQAQGDRSSADLANMIAESSRSVSIALGIWGLIFVVISIGLGAFINSEQKKTGENLKKTDENLKKTEKILEETRDIENKVILSSRVMDGVSDQMNKVMTDVNATRELIDNNLSDLYEKMQAEEVSFHLGQIKKRPDLIIALLERLMVLPFNENHFNQLKDLFVNQDEVQAAINLEFLYELLFHHFPIKWMRETELKEKLVNHHEWVLQRQNYPSLIDMVDNFCAYLQSNHPTNLDFQVGSLILEKGYELARSIEASRKVRPPKEVMEKRVGPDKHLTKELYLKLQNKSLRFQMYNVLKGYSCGRYFWDLLQNDYPDQEKNTEEENFLLNVCKDVYLEEDKAEDEQE